MVSDLVRINQITAWRRVLLQKLIVTQLVKKFPAFYGTRRYNAAFTRSSHCSLSLTRRIQSTSSQPIALSSCLILSPHVRLDIQSGLFPSGFPPKMLYTFPIYPMRALITVIIFSEAYKLWRSSLWILLQSPTTSSHLDLNILQRPVLRNPQSLFFP